MSKRKMFYAMVKFSTPAGGTLTILADDEDHAKKLLTKMHADVKDFEIIDVHDLDESPKIKAMIEAAAEAQDEPTPESEQSERCSTQKETLN